MVINFEKIGPDPPPPILDKTDEFGKDDEMGINRSMEGVLEVPNPNMIDRIPMANTNGHSNIWHNCRKMIYVPRTNQKGFPLGKTPKLYLRILNVALFLYLGFICLFPLVLQVFGQFQSRFGPS